eukprot:Plantae.Rhodophyta-Purpureofilum_apyrenoidigerum.ctg5554.p1 GENE.Plantae.Rhodophyta-Purpureofilum_apyrenoidigerum.ctg5554~~Plantae.Rhodophyta-Purpureofilum_apyrenoidigerum.ctg5554.p1  ORF type:complete len:275 (+),score=36.01 Plantae.Rhodophyta-Purpureofilum_apyrenoidigerum.ctg5554:83-826(+)
MVAELPNSVQSTVTWPEMDRPDASDDHHVHRTAQGVYFNGQRSEVGGSIVRSDIDPEYSAHLRRNLSSLLFVVDGPNVAYRHGIGTFSPKGVLYSHNFFARNGSSCVTVMPEGKLSIDILRASDSDMVADFNETILELRKLLKKGQILLTPSGDYDDSYVLHYAMSRGGIAVSNDRFNDHLHQAAARGPQYHSILAEFLKYCRLTFAFREDEFIPSPDFDIKKAVQHARSVAERFATEKSRWGFLST